MISNNEETAMNRRIFLNAALGTSASAVAGGVLAQERINTEMELARQVQELLLPQKQPQVPELDVYGVTHPAFEVGGDFGAAVNLDQRPCKNVS